MKKADCISLVANGFTMGLCVSGMLYGNSKFLIAWIPLLLLSTVLVLTKTFSISRDEKTVGTNNPA